MCKSIRNTIKLWICILIAFISPKLCAKFSGDANNEQSIRSFSIRYREAIFVTLVCITLGYLIAGLPHEIPWHKIAPTILIAFPVYGSSNAEMTWGGLSIDEEMSELFFKTIYSIGIVWLSWSIFMGLI